MTIKVLLLTVAMIISSIFQPATISARARAVNHASSNVEERVESSQVAGPEMFQNSDELTQQVFGRSRLNISRLLRNLKKQESESTETKSDEIKINSLDTKPSETTTEDESESTETTTETETTMETETIVETENTEEVISVEEVVEKYKDTISYNMDVTVLSGFSEEEFQVLMDSITQDDENNFFSVNAETILELCNEYEINEIFFCGIISQESWWGTANNCVYKNNYTGMMGSNGLIYYSSVYENLEATAKNLHNRYLTPGGVCYNGCTIYGVSLCYCDSSWADAVYGRMLEIIV